MAALYSAHSTPRLRYLIPGRLETALEYQKVPELHGRLGASSVKSSGTCIHLESVFWSGFWRPLPAYLSPILTKRNDSYGTRPPPNSRVLVLCCVEVSMRSTTFTLSPGLPQFCLMNALIYTPISLVSLTSVVFFRLVRGVWAFSFGYRS